MCQTARLIGFCDTSSKAYAAVIYLWIEVNNNVSVTFVAAKTRVTSIRSVSILRLELLSALLLSRLVASVEGTLQCELQLDGIICYTDLKVTLYWIQGKNHEWKQTEWPVSEQSSHRAIGITVLERKIQWTSHQEG